jgi:PmbA protein
MPADTDVPSAGRAAQLAAEEELLARARDAVSLATSMGAKDVFATAYRSRSVEMERRDGKIEKVTEATSRGLSLEVWVDGRFSVSDTTDLRPDRLQSFVADAVALTRALQPDTDRRITDPVLYAGRSTADLDLVDPSLPALTREDRVGWLEKLAAEVEGKPNVVTASSYVSDEHGLSVAVSSNGFEGAEEATVLWLAADATMRDGADKRPEGSMDGGARHTGDAPDATWVGREALAQANGRIGTKKGPTTKTTMIVHPRVAGKLISSLLQPASGPAVQQGRSFWIGRLGQPAVAEILTVTDEPLLPRGLSSRTFDGEGITAKPIVLIEDGRLVNYYLDTTYARKLEMAPTTGGPSNRVVAPGKRDLQALIGAADNAVLVTSWLGGNMDATSGDFSYGLRGNLIEKGQIGGPVGEMNVTGNIADLFTRLSEIGNDPWPYTSLRTPTLVFEGVQFSGA